jgi:transposase
LVWADQGYKKGLIEWAREALALTLEVVARPKGKGFQLLRRRWVVERTLAWLSNYRIHAKDYCHNPRSSEASVYAASVNLMLRRLCPKR